MTQHDHATYVEGCFRCDLAKAEEPEEFTRHCGYCDRDIIGIVAMPTMATITIKAEDLSIDATFTEACLRCAVAVIQLLGSRKGAL